MGMFAFIAAVTKRLRHRASSLFPDNTGPCRRLRSGASITRSDE